jgi:Carboxypeptidase regulatory-like domain
MSFGCRVRPGFSVWSFVVKIAHKLMLMLFGILALTPHLCGATGEPDTRIRGVVSDAAGAVVADVSVKLFSPEIVRETVTDDRGQFEFANVSGGGYDLEVDKPGFKTETVGNIQVEGKVLQPFSIALQVENSACGATPRVTFVARSDSVSLRGTIAELDGGAMKNATLRLTAESGQVHVATSNGKGEFQFADLLPGKYVLRAKHGHYWDRPGTNVRIARGNRTELSVIYMVRKDKHKVVVCQ